MGARGKRDAPVALCLFALLCSVYLLTFSGAYHSSDEMSMLAVTDSLSRRGAWDIELLRWMGEQQGSFGPDGSLYSRKGIGTTLATLPPYWLAVQANGVGNVQAAMLTNGVATALTGVLVYLLLRRLGYGRGVALGVALAFGLGTMAWPYARFLFSETLAGLGLMASAYFLVCYGTPGQNEDRDGREGYLLLAGAGLGLALLARLNNALAAPFLGLLLLYYLRRRFGWNWRAWIKPVLLLALPVLVSLAISGWYNWLRFGSPLTTGYLPEERFATPFFEGFYGLTFSPGKGLFWYNPLLLAALAAWPFFFRKHRAEALLAAAVVVANVAFYAPWYLWWAGHAWGPRFLVTVLPFAALALAPALDAARRRRLLAAGLILLAGISVAAQVLGVAVDFNLYLEDIHAELGLYHPNTLFHPAYSPLLRQIEYLRPGNLDLAWARAGSTNRPALLTGLGLALASALALVAACRGRLSRLLSGALLVLLAMGTVFTLRLYTPTAPPTGVVTPVARTLEAMERPGEAAALTEPLLTEAWQDAYDGRLWVWGVEAKEQVSAGQTATWVAGAGDTDPAAARFQVGALRLDHYPPPGQPFDVSRLPVPPLPESARPVGTPHLVSQAQQAALVELVSSQLDGSRTAPGATLGLGLYWGALAPMDTSYTVFVQLIDSTGAKAAQIDRLPCNGGCPTTTWRTGDLVGERYGLTVAGDAPPGQYELIAGMYDLATGENLTWLDAGGTPLGPTLSLGTVDIRP